MQGVLIFIQRYEVGFQVNAHACGNSDEAYFKNSDVIVTDNYVIIFKIGDCEGKRQLD